MKQLRDVRNFPEVDAVTHSMQILRSVQQLGDETCFVDAAAQRCRSRLVHVRTGTGSNSEQ